MTLNLDVIVSDVTFVKNLAIAVAVDSKLFITLF